MAKQVVCATCEQRFDAISESTGDRAYGCAAEATNMARSDTVIVCSYGSRFDGNVIDASAVSPTIMSGNVCDKCIEAVLKNGAEVLRNFMCPKFPVP